MTTGEKIIRINFNDPVTGDVAEVKRAFAELINVVEEKAHKRLEEVESEETENEVARLANSVIYNLESASFYATKALTA